MRKISLLLTEDEYYDFMDLLENATFSEFPAINHLIAEIILKKIEEDQDG